ncbi:MAG: hypothetical protein QOF29_550 [bacterium]
MSRSEMTQTIRDTAGGEGHMGVCQVARQRAAELGAQG